MKNEDFINAATKILMDNVLKKYVNKRMTNETIRHMRNDVVNHLAENIQHDFTVDECKQIGDRFVISFREKIYLKKGINNENS